MSFNESNEPSPHHRIAFVCVRNAGRSQMATAFAERERERRSGGDMVGIVSGGTRPADSVHPVVITAMRERDIDIGDRSPRSISPEELQAVELVITMGCSASDVCPAGWHGETRDWDLTDPKGRSIETVRGIRDEVEQNVMALFDELIG